MLKPPSVPSPIPVYPTARPLPDLISASDLMAHLGITRPTLAAWMMDAGFPRPLLLSDRRRMWAIDDVNRWLQSRKQG